MVQQAWKLGKRKKMIYGWFRGVKSGMDRECQKALRLRELGMVQPRISDMIKVGLLEECGMTRSPYTGQKVRLVRVKKIKGLVIL